MNVRLMGNTAPAFLQRKPRRRRGTVPKGGKAFVGARDLRLHKQLKKDGSLKSGRAGAYVYYVRKGRQRWRRCVVPRDPRTPAQQRSRAVFRAASKTWSADESLTDEQRAAWYAQGAKARSRPRLGTSGKLTGQQDFIGRYCAKGQRDRSTLLHPLKRDKNQHARKAHKPELIAEVVQSKRVTRSTSGTRRAFAGAGPCQRRVPRGYARKGRNRLMTTEAAFSKRLAKSTRDRPLTCTKPLPGRCRRKTRRATPSGNLGTLEPPPRFSRARRDTRVRAR